jgi:hypothetical protein
MYMDLDTFLTTVYVWIDDWYKAEGVELLARRKAGRQRMSDSEVLTIALAGQWRVGVPWRSERGVVRWMERHGQAWFPRMLKRSAFNERVRQLWGGLVRLQQVFAERLETAQDVYEVVDCVPLPSCNIAQAASKSGRWLLESTLGRGGNNGGWFYGHQVLTSVTPKGAVTGWLLGAAHDDDRWMLQAFISARAGYMDLVGPLPASGKGLSYPTGRMLLPASTGQAKARPYVADRGFNGARWYTHWLRLYHVCVISVPAANTPYHWPTSLSRWLSAQRQIVETVFSRLVRVFGWQHLDAHSTWGQLTRIAAKMSAYNIGLYLNQTLARPLGALETLFV